MSKDTLNNLLFTLAAVLILTQPWGRRADDDQPQEADRLVPITSPMQQLLRMGRGAVIPLDASVNDEVWILANNHPVARGEIQISDDKIAIAVTREANVYDFMAGGA